ncbi:MAG: ATP-binding protein [Thermodesulfobacteriota bacterium]|nr:ATP-binding protein [Thermodesulfobacteriota bacterium]
MTKNKHDVNKHSMTVAPLQNVALFSSLMSRVVNRPHHLPGMATFSGFSGYGKTWSAIYAANKHRAYYVELDETWTKKKLCQEILRAVGGYAKGHTIADYVTGIVEMMASTRLPLIVDEADYLVAKNQVNILRGIHDKSGAPVILIGEEALPEKLTKWERVHNRMLDWVQAEPASFEDGRHLARLYAPNVSIGDDLMQKITAASNGRVRRICVNIEKVREFAVTRGIDTIGIDEWGDQELFRAQPPKRRK